MSEAERTLANVLADTLAHHEASDLESLVLTGPLDEIGAGVVAAYGTPYVWLDFERAGRIVAAALVEVPTPAGWTGPTPLFSVRPSSTVPPAVERAVPRPGLSAPTPPATGPGELLERVIALAIKVMPHEPQRNAWVVEAMISLGRPRATTTLDDLGELNRRELLGLLERLGKWSDARARNARRRGLAGRALGTTA